MLKHKRARRALGATMVVVGGLLMWLAPDSIFGGMLLGAALILEMAGFALERPRDR
jgi:hypothetical protein